MENTDRIENALLDTIERIVLYPGSTVCKHWAALQVMQCLYELEHELIGTLVESLVNSDDESSISILKNRG